jgi:Flp pilus assembly protein TadD
MYKRYLESNAESSWALQNLGAAFMDLSKFNLALVYLRKAKQLTPNDAIIQRNIDRIAAIKKING